MIDDIPENLTLFDDLVASFNINTELAYKFLITFSWYEYALKQLGYVRDRGYVQIDWTRFGDELNRKFSPERTPILKAAVEYLQTIPPRSQIFNENHEIVWDDVDVRGRTPLAQILSRVSTVRNNFFHGGKLQKFRERDADLLRCCLVILDECVQIDSSIEHFYSHQIHR